MNAWSSTFGAGNWATSANFWASFPRTTAREVLEHAVLDRGGTADEAHDRAETMLTHFELDRDLWDSYVNTFSGGEKLRLNIAGPW